MMFARLAISALSIVAFLSLPAEAADYKKGQIVVEGPWARASAGPARAGAAYMTFVNKGKETDTLVGVESDISKRTEMHNHLMEDGVMKMRQVEGIEIAHGEPTVLQPGGLHVMFMGLHEPLKEGQTFPLTLVFQNAGKMTVDVTVQGVGAKGMSHGHGKHQMN